jgi:probable F420-dependent oxidoreductase
VKVDAQLKAVGIAAIEAASVDAERLGYDGIWSAETAHDPFLPVLLAAARTDHIEVGTAIAVAFARSPMTLAATAHDLQVLSQGRFRLGIGSQVKAHIERRFAMPWSSPAERMRDFIQAMRAIWADWNDGVPLDHDGPFYRHTLMTPMFRPQRSEWGPPPVHLAAVGDRMITVAGEMADGLIVHSFSSQRSLRERTLMRLEGALRDAGRQRSEVEVSLPLLVATGEDKVALARAVDKVRVQIAFYASTPAYRWVLDLHGLGDLGERLTELSRSQRQDSWARMAELVGDEVVREFAVVAGPDEVAAEVLERFTGLVDRVSLYLPYHIDTAVTAGIAAGIRGQPRGLMERIN